MFRIFTAIAFAATIGISAFFRRRARKQGETIRRSSESKTMIIGRFVVAVGLFGSVLLCMVYPPWIEWARVPLPVSFRWAGAVLGLSCAPFAMWVFRSIGDSISETVLTKQRHRLVTWGPYRWIRHPLYTTGLCLFLSAALMNESGLVLAASIAALLAVRFSVIPKEEANLLARFGSRYEELISSTGRFLPRW